MQSIHNDRLWLPWSCSPKQSPEFITEEMRLGAKVNTTEKGTMREFIESEISVIMKNLKVKKRVSIVYIKLFKGIAHTSRVGC